MKASETGQAVEPTSSRSSQETGRETPANPKRRRFLVVLAVTAAFAAAAAGMVTALAAPSSAVFSAAAPDAEASEGSDVAPAAEGSEVSDEKAQWAEHAAEELASKALFLETSMGPLLEEEIGVLTEGLETVLSPLVDDGTIDQTQLDAVVAAVVASVREKHQAMVDCFSELQALDAGALRALKEGNSEPPAECAEIFAEFEEKASHFEGMGLGIELSEDKADYLS